MDVIQRAKVRCRGPGDCCWASWDSCDTLTWDTSGEKGRQVEGRLCCWCPRARRHAPPHLLPSPFTPGWGTKVINKPTERNLGWSISTRTQAQQHSSTRPYRKRGNCSTCCHVHFLGGQFLVPVGFFFLLPSFLWKHILHNGSLPFFFSVIFWSHTILWSGKDEPICVME